MNWFDLLLIGVVAYYVIGGFVQGALKQLFSLFGFLIVLALAFLGSRFLSGYTAAWLKPGYFLPYHEAARSYGVELPLDQIIQLAAGALTFLALLLVLLIVFRLLLRGLTAVNRIPVVGFFNRFGGALLGLLIGLLFSFAVISAVSLLPLRFLTDALTGSQITGYLELYIPPFYTGLKEILIDYLLRCQAGG